MRKTTSKSIFASSKVVASATASTFEETALLATDIVRYARAEVSSSMRSSALENTIEYSELKADHLDELYTRLSELTDSEADTYRKETILQSIEHIKAQ